MTKDKQRFIESYIKRYREQFGRLCELTGRDPSELPSDEVLRQRAELDYRTPAQRKADREEQRRRQRLREARREIVCRASDNMRDHNQRVRVIVAKEQRAGVVRVATTRKVVFDKVVTAGDLPVVEDAIESARKQAAKLSEDHHVRVELDGKAIGRHPAVCNECGKWHRSSWRNSDSFCSTACRRKATDRSWTETRKQERAEARTRQCDNCGQSFTPARNDARYCGAKCRVYAGRQRKAKATKSKAVKRRRVKK